MFIKNHKKKFKKNKTKINKTISTFSYFFYSIKDKKKMNRNDGCTRLMAYTPGILIAS